VPAVPVPVQTTGGAGDAHLAGLLGGMTAGLSLAQAQRLAALLAASSVTSQHTIYKGVTRAELARLAARLDEPPAPALAALLAG
jgi:sugar/nucleoside kinase (ribokinase family)